LDPLPDNWEMAYTEKGEVYFIEWVSDISLNITTEIIAFLFLVIAFVCERIMG
jgi:hypothetical protein